MKRILLVMMGCLIFSMALAHTQLPVININTANVSQLVSLKGIGPKKAAAIIKSRKQSGPFHSLNELLRVKGISKVFLQRLLEQNSKQISAKAG